jgi:hypothetical protein
LVGFIFIFVADIIQIYNTEVDRSLVLNIGESRFWTLHTTNYSKIRAVALVSLVRNTTLTHQDDYTLTAETLHMTSAQDFFKCFNFGFKYSTEGFPTATGPASYFGFSSGFDTFTNSLRNDDNTVLGPRIMRFSRMWMYSPSSINKGVMTAPQVPYYLGLWGQSSFVSGGMASVLMVDFENIGTTFTLRAGAYLPPFRFLSGETFYSKNRIDSTLNFGPQHILSFNHGGSLLPPDQIFIYSPFVTYRLAIHAFVLQYFT